MELTVAAVTTTAIGLAGAGFIRRYTNAKVNCWFCNQNSKVPYSKKNAFDCTHCGQYNGFTDSGDYNKRIPGQQTIGSIPTNGRYCTPHNSVLRGNGLCEPCNVKQTTIMKQVAEFEPLNEDRWEEELEEFKYKLDKVYALCPSCSLFAHRKLEDDKRQFSYLLNLRESILPGVRSACRNVVKIASRVAHRHRRSFFSGGKVTEVSHFLSLVSTAAVFIANLHYLQEDAGVEFIMFPDCLQDILPSLIYFGRHMLLFSLFSHILALMCNKNRTTLPDLIFPISTIAMLLTYFVSEENYHEDLILFRCALTSFMIVISSAITFVPRKKLHKKRPNKILLSAFSVASTPASQCSTANDSIFESDEERSNTPPLVRNHMKWRERAQTPEPRGMNLTASMSPEEMEWETSTANTSFSRDSRLLNPMFFNNARNTTPARELAPSLSSLSIVNGERLQNRYASSMVSRTPSKHNAFPSFTSDIVTDQYKNGSLFGVPKDNVSVSAFSSVSKRTMRRMNDSPVLPEPSLFTSVSQQQSSTLGIMTKIIIGTLVFSSFLGNIAFFYFVFRMQSKNYS